jgi:hypothetical protein
VSLLARAQGGGREPREGTEGRSRGREPKKGDYGRSRGKEPREGAEGASQLKVTREGAKKEPRKGGRLGREAVKGGSRKIFQLTLF